MKARLNLLTRVVAMLTDDIGQLRSENTELGARLAAKKTSLRQTRQQLAEAQALLNKTDERKRRKRHQMEAPMLGSAFIPPLLGPPSHTIHTIPSSIGGVLAEAREKMPFLNMFPSHEPHAIIDFRYLCPEEVFISP